MNKKVLGLILGIVCLAISDASPVQAQKDDSNAITMQGTIERDSRMSGSFSRLPSDRSRGWCVFVGATGKVYKLSLLNGKLDELYIDGQRVPDGQVSRYVAEYEPFLKNFLRSREIENESELLEKKIQPLGYKLETLSKETEKLDQLGERFEQMSEKSRADAATDRASVRLQQKRLTQLQNELERQLEPFTKTQERLSDEQESLGLHKYIDEVLNRIVTDLKALNVVRNTDKLSFKFSSRELIVNGNQVAADVFERLKAKYLVDTGVEAGFLFRWKGNV